MKISITKQRKEYGLTARMIAMFVVLVILPFLLLAVFVVVFFRNYSINNIQTANVDSMNSIGTQISSAVHEIEEDSMSLYYSGVVEVLATDTPLTVAEENNINTTIKSMTNSIQEIGGVHIETEKHGIIGTDSYNNVVQLMEPYRQTIVDAGGRCLWYSVDGLYGKSKETKYVMARSLNSSQKKNVGICYIVVKDRMVTEIFNQVTNNYSIRYLLDKDGNVLYSSGEKADHEKIDLSFLDSRKKNSFHILRMDNREKILISRKIMSNGWYCISVIDMNQVFYNMRKLTLPFILICAVYLLFLILTLQVFRNYVFKPLRILKKSMDTYATDGFSPTHVEIGGFGEFQSLSRHFNNMMVRIERLVQDYKEEVEEKNRQERKALTAQLTPHFIYNSLNTIKWMAVLNHQQNIQNQVESLIYIFQNAARADDDSYTIQDEVTLMENYAVIQKARFMNFDLVLDVEDDCRDLLIKKLLIQPILENAIIHGLGRGKIQNTSIVIKIWRDELLNITVEDHGYGFDVKAWRENPEKKKNHTNIGIHNIEKIIQLEYGEEYKMIIESQPGQGTLVTYRLPILYKNS